MSSAIDFAVRTAAGGTTYGNVAGPGQSNFIQAGLGDSLSLNLTPQSVIGYTRNGNDLVIELSDGRTITVADWFDAPPGNPNTLYLSSDGMVTEVQLTDPGDGLLVADFSLAAGHEKWSPLDDLRFDNSDPVVTLAGTGSDDPAGMGIFAPALMGWGGPGWPVPPLSAVVRSSVVEAAAIPALIPALVAVVEVVATVAMAAAAAVVVAARPTPEPSKAPAPALRSRPTPQRPTSP